MRILVLNHNLRERGTYFRARQVALGLWRRGHDVTFCGTGPGFYRPRVRARRERWTHVESANWCPGRGADDGWSPLGLLQRLARLRGPWDLIYTFSHQPVDQFAARALRGANTFWMTDWCDLWSSAEGGLHDTRLWAKPLPPKHTGWRGRAMDAMFRIEDRLEFSAPRDADATSIIVSPMREYTRRLGIADERVLLLASGADTASIRPLDRAECRAQLGLPANGLVLGYVANVTPDNLLLEAALERVWREFPDARLLSVGPRWYPTGGSIERAVAQGRVLDFDRRPFAEVPPYMGAADILLMPIRDVPFNRCRWPNKFGDYMAAGRAIAACDVGDMGEIVRRCGVGAAGPPTSDGLADAIIRLGRDAALRDECAARARETAVQRFSWPRKISRLCRFLRSRGVPA